MASCCVRVLEAHCVGTALHSCVLGALHQWLLDGEFELHTDSVPLAWIHQKKTLLLLHVHRLDVTAEFKYTVAHIPGKLNIADPL